MKKMTTREAWLYLAKAWDTSRWCADRFISRVNGICCSGLCPGIEALRNTSVINDSQRREMLRVIDPNNRYRWNYRWRLNKAGARARAEFCRAQAKRTRKEPTT
jgi:hypothetical protein